MAPEVMASAPRDSTSDVYSLGCVFLELQFALMLNEAISVANFSPEMHNLLQYLRVQIDTHLVPPRLPSLDFWIDLIGRMTQDDASSRIRIENVAATICQQDRVYRCQLCGLIQRRLGPAPKDTDTSNLERGGTGNS